MKVIIRMPNWLGDAVMATPVLLQIINNYSDVWVAANPSVCQLLNNFNCKFYEISNVKDYRKFLRKNRFDLGILLTNSFSSAWQFFLGKVKLRVGFQKDYRSILLSKKMPYPTEKTMHQVQVYKQLLHLIDVPLGDIQPKLILTGKDYSEIDQLFKKFSIDKTKPIIGMNPGAAYGTAKCWLPERFREVTRRCLKHIPNAQVIFFGDKKLSSLVETIIDPFEKRVYNFAGLTCIRQLIASIDLCDVFLTNDSGPMHIASALKTPLIALFGSTSEIKTGPIHVNALIHKHVSCSPCFQRTCPIDFKCMKRITSNEVFNHVLEIVNDKKADKKNFAKSF